MTIGFRRWATRATGVPLFQGHAGRGEEGGNRPKFADAQGKEEDQLKAVRAFIAQKVDAIVIAPVVVTGWGQVLEEAKKAASPCSSPIATSTSDKSLFVDPHLRRLQSRRPAGRRLAGAASKGTCNIVELQGTVGSAPAIERKKGSRPSSSNFPDMKIVKSQSGDFTTDGGKKVMEAFIKSTDKLKGICRVFAHNDNMQLGAIQAMKEAGLKPGKDVLMVSVDYVPAIKEALAAGDAKLRSSFAPPSASTSTGRAQYLKDRGTAEVGGHPADLHTAATPGG